MAWRSCLLVGALVAGAAGCTGAVNTDNPTTYDLLVRSGELDSHLEGRRGELAGLQSQLAGLDERLSFQMRELRLARSELATGKSDLSSSEAEIEAVRQEILVLETSAREAEKTFLALQAQRAELERKIAVAGLTSAMAAERDALQMRIRELEGEIGALERAVARTLSARERRVLRGD
jgi:chromosome segregation ATPase